MTATSLASRAGIYRLLVCGLLLAVGAATTFAQFAARHPVPGRGQKLPQVGDDFEEEGWEYISSAPKASMNLDGQDRLPAGISKNNRIYESTYRGQPDVVRLIDTPPGGLPNSKKSLYLRSRDTGIPGSVTRKQQQDDLLVNVSSVIGPVPVSNNPSIVVRVFLPPFEYWEKRTGASFGFRAELEGSKWETTTAKKGLFSRVKRSFRKEEPYWPGFFIQFNSKTDGVNKEDSAVLLVRCDEQGRDLPGPTIKQTGWWTLGMSFTGDGLVHYFASPGVDPLTDRDYIATTKPYGQTGEYLNTFFFNVVTPDDGRSWSTEWVIDDPALYSYTR
ncbi:MAG: hypothetical protein ACT4QC_18760 [Planctomycetaceae bacterium]